MDTTKKKEEVTEEPLYFEKSIANVDDEKLKLMKWMSFSLAGWSNILRI